MNTITHALIPLIAAGIYERSYRVDEGRRHLLSIKMLIAVGVFGAAPDILNPHLSLDARYTSWSHGLIFWLILTVCISLFSVAKRKVLPPYMIPWLSGAYLLHIICDAISGGVAWSYPFGQSIVGAYYVAPIWWIPLDIALFLTAYGTFRVVPKMRGSQKNNSG